MAALAAGVPACQDSIEPAPAEDVDQVPLSTFEIDTNVQPQATSLPGFDDGVDRPLAAVEDEQGLRADFVADELWISTADSQALDELLKRWNGTILATIDAAMIGDKSFVPQYLVRVDTSSAQTELLAEDMHTLDPQSHADLRVSSEAGMQLMAAAAHESVLGLTAGLNYVGRGDSFTDRQSFEAPAGPTSYDPNVFEWPSHNAGSVQDIGVTEAWRALELAGKLESGSVDLAILDMGFVDSEDLPDGWLAISNVPFVDPMDTENLLSCGGGSDCPWHGTNVMSAAMAVPDNGFGSAGPAGPVADPVLVFTSYDFFTSISALTEARVAGAKIANMSYSAPVPSVLAFSVLPFDAGTWSLRNGAGMLLFAAAGNGGDDGIGDDVDSTYCLPWPADGVCFEKTWHTPCENSGVICVGGLGSDSKARHSSSNYGHEHVDIFAPFTLWLGPDPDNPGNMTQSKSGTSFSSPYAAGVAALIKAADPGLSADAVESILLQTAHTSPDPEVGRYVNAAAAVRAALGNVPPAIEVINPDDGDARGLNHAVSFWATVDDFEDGNPCCVIEWTSDVDGLLSDQNSFDYVFSTPGSRMITLRAEDSAGATSSVSFELDIVNTAPTVEITRPTAGEEVLRGVPTLLRGTSTDPNEVNDHLPCSSTVWTSSNPADVLGTGCDLDVTFTSNGQRTLTLTGTDSEGLQADASVTVEVVDPPADLPPQVQITSPANGSFVGPFDLLALSADVTDDNDAAADLSYEWAVSWSGGSAVIGSTEDGSWTPADTITFAEGQWDLELTLTVTDTAGNEGSDFVEIHAAVIE